MRKLSLYAAWSAMCYFALMGLQAHAMTVEQIEKTYRAALIYASQHSGIPPRVLAAVIYLESSGDPWARSSTGAIGLMQLRPRSGGFMGYLTYSGKPIVPSDEYLLDWWNNIVIGASYLAYLEKHYFNGYPSKVRLALALAAYNFGVTNVLRALKESGQTPENVSTAFSWMKTRLPASVADYVYKVFALARASKMPQ